MVKILMHGCSGHMGRVIAALAEGDPEIEITAGVDPAGSKSADFPVYRSVEEFGQKGKEEVDVAVDFSTAAAADELLAYCARTQTPCVLCTTGLSEAQLAGAEEAAKSTAILRSANMSLGINVLLELVKKASSILGNNYDIEIVERHHRRKVDAPSGTALMIADAAAQACSHETQYVFERHSAHHSRDKKEIGISSVRGGTIVGEHEIIFAGHDEIVEIKHTALSREIFAQGAVAAAKFIASVEKPGLYDMSCLVT